MKKNSIILVVDVILCLVCVLLVLNYARLGRITHLLLTPEEIEQRTEAIPDENVRELLRKPLLSVKVCEDELNAVLTFDKIAFSILAVVFLVHAVIAWRRRQQGVGG